MIEIVLFRCMLCRLLSVPIGTHFGHSVSGPISSDHFSPGQHQFLIAFSNGKVHGIYGFHGAKEFGKIHL